MAEIKNTFLRGKMNKDLDSRLIQNGEYRDALNISVGKSENQSVGSAQNILGNKQLVKPTGAGTAPFESNENLVCIGQFVDNDNNRLFQLLTDYTDPDPLSINLPSEDYEMKITLYDPSNTGNPYTVLLSGAFLNFSTTNLVTGINLVENLLFWTDNRNQPRKINVNKALLNSASSVNPYYVLADQISVAKYAPFKSPILYKVLDVIAPVFSSTFSTNEGQTLLIFSSSQLETVGLEVGDQLIDNGLGIDTSDFAVVTYISPSSGGYNNVYISGQYTISSGYDLTFRRTTMKNNASASTYSGEENFLKDKFVRFSYRFRFDDNEYSLMAPFTQPAFIPTQKGYFINGDEDAAYRSTVVSFMENNVNEITLMIELPEAGDNLFNLYKIRSIDILYKESDSLSVKVIETIDIDTIEQEVPSSNLYYYKYNSQKPYKTLQEAETTRVYDKTPVRALAQDVSGNRVIYGNYINQNTPPESLDYNVSAIQKNDLYESWLEYPNHTLKQNRTYQVGVVLADKFGRQSSVILSSALPYVNTGGFIYGSSSIYVPYKNDDWTTSVKDWLGDTLALTFNTTINSNKNSADGTPGLYATPISKTNTIGFSIISASIYYNDDPLVESVGWKYIYYEDTTPGIDSIIPAEGNWLRGQYTDYVEILNVEPLLGSGYKLTTSGRVNEIYEYNPANTPDLKFCYNLNELGWYSYKIVVKQQQQEYYNVYVPGMLAGYPVWQTNGTGNPTQFPTGESEVTCHFVSINDNINKVPRDLSEVGPNQTQYRSSVKLWGRVENQIQFEASSGNYFAANKQYYPTTTPDTVSTIAPSNDLGFLEQNTTINPVGSAYFNIYQLETSPLINRVSTSKKIGVVGNTASGPTIPTIGTGMSPFLGVYETAPVTTALDLFWETSTTGYISDLNADILTGSDAIIGYTNLGFEFNEDQDYDGPGNTTGASNSPWITEWFDFVNKSGAIVNSIDSIVFSAANRDGQNLTSSFELVRETNISDPNYLKYRIKILNSNFYYGTNFATYGSFIFTFQITHTVLSTTYNPIISTVSEVLQISNAYPIVTSPSANVTPVYNLTNAPLIGPIIDVIGKNGSFSTVPSDYLSDLYWMYDPIGPSYYGYFSVNSSTGDVSVTNSNIPIGVYDLRLKLQDASTSLGLQSFGGLSSYRTVRLQVPDTSVGCASWTSVSTDSGSGTTWSNMTSGYINVWKMLRAGETIIESTVKLSGWVQYFTSTSYAASVPVSFTNGEPYGYFNAGLFNNNEFSARQAAQTLYFTGNIITSSGRSIDINYGSNQTNVTTEINIQSSGCTAGVPTGYIPSTCREWTIYNNSSFPIPFNGLHGNGRAIIGGVIEPGQYAKSTGEGGTYPVARYLSLQAAGTGTIGGVITYTGAVTCPL